MKKIFLVLLILIASNLKSYSQKIIEMESHNGVYFVPCKVNGIPMKFIFDTGASNVSISLTEAMFLLKQGVLKDEDLKESVKYQIANGEIQEGTKIIIREINIDGVLLKNIKAGIVHELNAPLLLGQSAISKLGNIRLDGNKLIIESEIKDEEYTKFLNIDVTKTFEDYNLPVKLNELPIDDKGLIDAGFPLNLLAKNNSHFLQDFYFDTEIARFDKNGFLRAILLSKNSKNINLEFYKLSERIRSIYGVASKYGGKANLWKKPYYEIVIFKKEDGLLSLILNVKRNDNILRSELRANWVKMINEYYESSDKNRKGVIRFVRTEENKLAVYIQSDLEYNKNRFKSSGQENEWITFLCYNSALVLFEDEDFNKIIVNELKYENIEFNVELTYYGIDRVKVKKQIRKTDIEKLRVPFTEGELIDIIN